MSSMLSASINSLTSIVSLPGCVTTLPITSRLDEVKWKTGCRRPTLPQPVLVWFNVCRSILYLELAGPDLISKAGEGREPAVGQG